MIPLEGVGSRLTSVSALICSARSTTASISSPTVQESEVVVICLDLDNGGWPRRRVRDGSALLGRHDRVLVAVDDRRRQVDALDVLDQREAVSEQRRRGGRDSAPARPRRDR